MPDAALKNKETTSGSDELSGLRNVGPATRRCFRRLGIETIEQLAAQDPDTLYEQLSALSQDRVDPCVHDVFSATIHQARTGEPVPWWTYSAARKQRQTPR